MKGLEGQAYRQNQDFQDSTGSSLTGKRLSVFVLAEFTVMAKIASWAKRNPANLENPDSDKDARMSAASHKFRGIRRDCENRNLPCKPIKG